MIGFNCSHCGHHLEVDPALSGTPGWCRKCKGIVIVPGPGVRPYEDLPREEQYEVLQRLLKTAAERADACASALRGTKQNQDALRSENEELRAINASYAGLESRLERLADLVAALSKTVEAAHDQRPGPEAALEEVHSQHERLCQSVVEHAEDQDRHLSQDTVLELIAHGAGPLEQRMHALNTRAESLETRAQEVEEQLAEHREAAAQAAERIARLEAAPAPATEPTAQELSALRAEFEQAQTIAAQSQEAIEALRRSVAERAPAAEEQNAALADLREMAAQERAAREALEQRLDELHRRLAVHEDLLAAPAEDTVKMEETPAEGAAFRSRTGLKREGFGYDEPDPFLDTLLDFMESSEKEEGEEP